MGFQDYILKDKGLAVDTARHYLAILKKICRMAFKEGHAEKRYFVNFKLPQENRKPPRALSREDFEKIRDVVIPPERITHNIARDLFLFACYTGFRMRMQFQSLEIIYTRTIKATYG